MNGNNTLHYYNIMLLSFYSDTGHGVTIAKI